MKIMVFDVGGTEIKYSVMDEQMHRTNSGAVPTPQDTQAQFLDAVYRLYAPHKDEVTGIAMALPGFVDNHTGYVSNGGALLYNTATPVGQLLAEKCSCPVILENDGKAAAMAELANGALKGCCNAAVFIIGTGVGGGIIANGQLVRGVHFTAGEYSFVNTNAEAWDAPDQNMACQCSTSNLLKWYRARKALPEDAPLDGRSFFAAANAGEPEALEGKPWCWPPVRTPERWAWPESRNWWAGAWPTAPPATGCFTRAKRWSWWAAAIPPRQMPSFSAAWRKK